MLSWTLWGVVLLILMAIRSTVLTIMQVLSEPWARLGRQWYVSCQQMFAYLSLSARIQELSWTTQPHTHHPGSFSWVTHEAHASPSFGLSTCLISERGEKRRPSLYKAVPGGNGLPLEHPISRFHSPVQLCQTHAVTTSSNTPQEYQSWYSAGRRMWSRGESFGRETW